MHPYPPIAAILRDFANSATLPEIDLSLDRMWQLLAALGNPQEKLPPVIHVAGTNGKGSVIAYLRAMYTAAGYRVHVYTSPHLVTFNERIVIAGDTILDAPLLGYLQRVQACKIPVTFFEATTAAAFLAFSEVPADVLLLETGLGGRLDATNVVAQPLCTVITPIDFDHQEFLGESLAQIAGEKAGIMKRNTPCVAAAQQEEAQAVLEAHTAAVGAPLILGGRDWKVEGTFLPSPNLVGAHQIANAALAAMTANICMKQLPITNEQIAYGITHAVWPARLQRLTRGAVVDAWRGEVFLDGGHNAHAAHALATLVMNQPAVLICAMMRRKNAVAFFAELAPHVKAVCCIPMPEEGGYTSEELADAARTAGIAQVITAQDILAAAAVLSAHAPATLLIAGSLYLAGEVLKTHG